MQEISNSMPQSIIDISQKKKMHAEVLRENLFEKYKIGIGEQIAFSQYNKYYCMSSYMKGNREYLFIKESYEDESEFLKKEEYYFEVKRNNSSKPAYKMLMIKIFDEHDRLHSIEGPSIMNFDPNKNEELVFFCYYINGQFCSIREYKRHIENELKVIEKSTDNLKLKILNDTKKILGNIDDKIIYLNF